MYLLTKRTGSVRADSSVIWRGGGACISTRDSPSVRGRPSSASLPPALSSAVLQIFSLLAFLGPLRSPSRYHYRDLKLCHNFIILLREVLLSLSFCTRWGFAPGTLSFLPKGPLGCFFVHIVVSVLEINYAFVLEGKICSCTLLYHI